MSNGSIWNPGLRLRLVAPAVLVALPAIALFVYMSVDPRMQAERALTQNAERLADLASADQERLIEGTRQLLIAIAQGRDVREGDQASCDAYLRQLVPEFGTTYNNLAVFDTSGSMICNGISEAPISVADRQYFRQAIASRAFVVGDYIVGRQTGRPSLPFCYPVFDQDGNLRGIAFAALDIEQLNQRLTSSDWPPDATLTVTDRNQTIVARHPDWQKQVGTSLSNDPVTAQIGSRASGSVDYEENGEQQLFAFARIAKPVDTGLTVRVSVSKTQAMAAANRSMYEGLVALGLVSLIVMIGVKAASDRLLLEPITQLGNASRRLAAGDLGARVASSTAIPELNELGKDFDAMAATLEEREAARLSVEMERKDLEQQYYQAQKMDAVGRLAGGIAHDFNNMLTAILGYAELLIADPEVGDAQRDDVREIDKAGRTAAALTRQLLAFSRREIVEPTVLDLNLIVSGMEKMLYRLVGEQISMETRLATPLEPVKADRGQIEQVILNLVVNARDAMPHGGRLLIETANVDLPEGAASAYLAAAPGRYVMVAVTDAGCGMTQEVLAHLFEPFFTTKGTGKGTGLGLATVYGIAKQNGGGIVVQSALDGGSTFRIYLPRCDEERASGVAASRAAERTRAGKATILIVEDDAIIRELASKVLSKCGYTVLAAFDGEDACRVCQRHTGAIDVLLSDVVMPGMTGPMVAQALKRMRPAMKVVYMSGYTDDAIVVHGVMTRDVPFLQKPFTPERLTNKLLEVLG